MGATRIALTMLCLLVLANPASAQSIDVVVFGPISDGNAKLEAGVKAAMAKVNAGTQSPKPIDLACAATTECLVTSGAEASARRALAVTIVNGKIGFVMVDVVDKELIAKRDVTIAEKKLAKDFPRAFSKFLDEAPTERAKALFAVGNRHYELGEYAQALEIYKKAYRVKALPAFQFNIAQCHRKLGQHKEAIQLYQAYLVGVPNASNRTLVESLITESKNQIAAAEKAVRDSEQAKLDTEKKKAEEARLAAEAARKAKEAEANAEAERRKQLQAKLDADRQRKLDSEYNRHPARKWMLLTGGLGLATAGVGGYFAYRVKTRQSTYDDNKCGVREELLGGDALDDCLNDIDIGRRDARLANILIGAGGGVALVSLVVLIIDPGNLERPSQERASVRVTPNSIQAVFRW